MGLDQEENTRCGIRLGNRCFKGECPDAETIGLVNFDWSESDEWCEDVADLLPDDPFGMDHYIFILPKDPFGMEATTFAYITDWIEDDNENDDDNNVITELNVVWTSYERYEQGEGDNEVVGAGLCTYSEGDRLGGEEEDLVFFGCEKYQNVNVKDRNDVNGGSPPDALFFALSYLGVKDLLSVERVCKSMRDAVRNDPLLWGDIHISYPLSDKITNDDLLRLTNRSQGTLSSLSLVKCSKITNVALKQVLESNPRLTKVSLYFILHLLFSPDIFSSTEFIYATFMSCLIYMQLSVPGCIKLSVEGILNDLKAFNAVASPGIKHLRIGQLFGLTNQHFAEFKLLLGADEDKNPSNYEPRYYGAGQLYLSLDDERTIDIDMCPRCQQARQVYDCPSESCQVENNSTKTCRGCIFCISRCLSCGCCLDDKAYEETFCLDLLCLDCLDQLFNWQDGVWYGPKCTYFHQMTSYHFFLYS